MSPRSCVSLSQLSSLVVDEVGSFDQANTACALNRLAKMYSARYTSLSQTNLLSGDEQQQARRELRPALEALTKRLSQVIYSCSAWDVSISLWSFAQLGWHDEATLQSLCEAALQLTPTFKPADCAQTVIAFTQIGYVHPELLRHIVTVGLDPTAQAHLTPWRSTGHQPRFSLTLPPHAHPFTYTLPQHPSSASFPPYPRPVLPACCLAPLLSPSRPLPSPAASPHCPCCTCPHRKHAVLHSHFSVMLQNQPSPRVG